MFIDKGQKMSLTSASGQKVSVRLEVNPRAKRIILRIDGRTGEAVAVAPTQRKLADAAAFARTRLAWITAQLERSANAIRLEEGATIPLRGIPHTLTAAGTGRLAHLVEGDPPTLHLPGAPESLSARALRYLKRTAKEDLTRAVAFHADRLGVTPRRISVKDTRSRWGSCSHEGNLSFSWRLILAEPFVLDYVAAHEVAHLIEMNHSPAFWAQVERTYPDWRPARKWLHANGDQLHAIS